MAEDTLTPILDFLRRHAPFDRMQAAHLEFLARRLTLSFFARGEVIVDPENGPADRLFIIKQGHVRGGAPDEDVAWELAAGEIFPVGALLSRRPPRTESRAVEDSFCFELDRDAFDYLLKQSPVFHDFCTRRLANLLDEALRGIQARSASRLAGNEPLAQPLVDLIRRSPVHCHQQTPLADALNIMQQQRVGSLMVLDDEQSPVGVFTLHDVLERVTLAGRPLSTPIQEVMTEGPISLPPHAHAYEAALLMARKGFGHIAIVDEGRLIGVISERDLFALRRIGLTELNRGIADATDIDTLAELSRQIPPLIEQMLAFGASVEQLTQLITALNDSITRRVITLISESCKPRFAFTWLSFGSEGRHEQTLKTDQDNGILFSVPDGHSADDVRVNLLPMAEQINQALDRCGFPLCPGNIMASNPACCLSLDEWKARFSRWIDQGTPEHLLNATIYFDFRPLFGDKSAAKALRSWLGERAEPNSRFRRQLAENALRIRPPLGLLRDFVVSSGGEHPHTFDLKLQGVTPFVDAARIIALANRITETNTAARLQAAAKAGALAPGDVSAWVEAYHYIQLLRMRNHRRQAEQGLPLDNHFDPDELNALDRRILKEAFRQARKLQAKLALEYQL